MTPEVWLLASALMHAFAALTLAMVLRHGINRRYTTMDHAGSDGDIDRFIDSDRFRRVGGTIVPCAPRNDLPSNLEGSRDISQTG